MTFPRAMLETLTDPSSAPVMTVEESEWTAQEVIPARRGSVIGEERGRQRVSYVMWIG